MNRDQEIRRAEKAREILSNELWQEAVENIDRNLLAKMAEYHSDPAKCQEVALTKKISSLFVQFFQDIADTGKMAVIQLETERTRQTKRRKSAN